MINTDEKALGMSLWPSTFAQAYCVKYDCKPDSFEKEIFNRCSPLSFRLAMKCINCFKPYFFRDDREVIRRCGKADSSSSFYDEIEDFNYVVKRDGGFLRYSLGMHVSIPKIKRLKADLFG